MEKHFAVSGFVTNREHTKLLMVHHKKLNVWVTPGGHLEPNELPHEGALREVKEETGVDAVVVDASPLRGASANKESQIPNPILTLQEIIPGKGGKPEHIHIDLIFLFEADEGAVAKQEEEVNDVKWMTWDEILETDTFGSIKAFANSMLGGDIYARAKNRFDAVL